MPNIRLRISGRVQGVGYRHWFRSSAGKLGLTGWVRNRLDGSVEALISGHAEILSQMVKAAETGPPMAKVDKIIQEITDEEVPESGMEQAPTV